LFLCDFEVSKFVCNSGVIRHAKERSTIYYIILYPIYWKQPPLVKTPTPTPTRMLDTYRSDRPIHTHGIVYTILYNFNA